MRLTVVQCGCGNPEPHKIFRTENGRETKGFFSLAEGRRMHVRILASGDVKQTDEERAATEQEINSCGLPEEYLPSTPESPAAARPPLGESSLQLAAAMLKEHLPDYRRELVEMGVRRGIFTAEDGEKIFALAAIE